MLVLHVNKDYSVKSLQNRSPAYILLCEPAGAIPAQCTANLKGEKPAESQTSNRLASSLVRARLTPNQEYMSSNPLCGTPATQSTN